MKKTKISKSKFKISLKLWGIISSIMFLFAIFLLITYNKTQDIRSRAEGSQIQFINRTFAQVGGEDMFITADKPNDIEEGDILIAMIGSDYAHVDSMPPGWKLIRQNVKNKGHIDDLALQSYYKIVTADEESSYTWNLVTGRDDTPSEHQPLIAVEIYAFRGVDQNNPIFSSGSHGESTNPEAIKCPSVKGITGGMLLCSYMGDDPGTIKAPETMTQTVDFVIGENGDSYAAAYESLSSESKTGNRTAIWDNPESKNGSDFAQAIVLRPAE